jgi:hypothetical protein
MSQHSIKIEGTDTRLALVEQSYHMLEEKLEGVHEGLNARIDRVEAKVDLLGDEMRKGQTGLVKVVIGTAGTIVVAILSLIGVMFQYM